jgi:signal transduction histidine kinase
VPTTRSPNPRKWPNITSLPKALINAANHIRASQVTVCAQSHRGLLHLSIQDDGVGGANCAKGSADVRGQRHSFSDRHRARGIGVLQLDDRRR